MNRDEFMELVYETFADEPDNVLANGIIEAADAYAEHEKAQLSKQCTTSDLISKFIDDLEEIFANIREKHVDESVCGLCEYDGAYIGQSGDWCNECPGFDRDDCFKLSDETRKKWIEEILKALPSVQPGKRTEERTETHTYDLISRKAAIDEIKNYCKNGCDIAEDNWCPSCQREQFIELLKVLPSVQPDPHEGHWIWVAGDLECSECHTRYPDLYPDYDNSVACPHCGAHMKGERQK